MGARLAALLAALTLGAGAAGAQDTSVALTSQDGSVSLEGRLIDFDGEFYRLDTIYGAITVDGTSLSCAGPGCPDDEARVAELTFSGTPSIVGGLMPPLVESFAARRNLTLTPSSDGARAELLTLADRETGQVVMRVRLRTTNSSEGFADLLAREADVVLSSREIRPDERSLAIDAGLGNLSRASQSEVLALDGLVPVVPMGRRLGAISVETLARVVAGEITDWSELGSEAGPIRLHLPEIGSGLMEFFTDFALAPLGLSSAPGTRHAQMEALSEAVRRDPQGFGLSAFSGLRWARPVPLGGGCGIEQKIGALSLKTEDYPLTAPLFLYVPARHFPPLSRALLAELDKAAASVVVRRSGFVDRGIVEVALEDEGRRLANAVTAANGSGLGELKRLVRGIERARRLSIAFRFEGGSSALDAQSRANIALLARAVDTGAFDRRTLVFAGFTDGEGPSEVNLQLARSRAETVRSEIRRTIRRPTGTGPTMRIEGFGEALPLACDDEAWGKRVNRRVEVWVE